MRQQYCEVLNKEQAETLCPWACKIIKVCGGYLCFESITDYEIWKNQD